MKILKLLTLSALTSALISVSGLALANEAANEAANDYEELVPAVPDTDINRYGVNVTVGYYKNDLLESEGTRAEAELIYRTSNDLLGRYTDQIRYGVNASIDDGLAAYGASLGYAAHVYKGLYLVPRIGVEHFRDKALKDSKSKTLTNRNSGNYMNYSLGAEYDLDIVKLDVRIGYLDQFNSSDKYDRDGKFVMVGLSKQF